MNLSDLLSALRARWKLEVAAAFVVFAAVVVWTVLSPRAYTGTASLLFDQAAPDPAVETSRSVAAADILGTEAEVIHSQEVAAKVAHNAGLADNPIVLAQWRAATGGAGSPEDWIGRNLLRGLTVEAGRNATILSISYKAGDAASAAQIANGFAQTYINEHLRMTTDPARAYAHWFEERTHEVRNNLEQAQNRLTNFQRDKGIVSTENMDAEAERLNALSTQLASAESANADAASRAGAGSAGSPDVQSNGVVQSLRTQIAQKAAQVSELRTNLGPNHPDMVAATAELASLRARLAGEVGTTSHSLSVASGDTGARVGSLRRLVDQQRGRMLALSTDRSQLEVLQRDVQSARAAFDAVTQRLSSMRLQAELPRTNVRLLDSAMPPAFPSNPNVPLRIVLGVLLGGFVGLTLGAVLEWWRPRVRTQRGLVVATGVPVLMAVDFNHPRLLPYLGKEVA